MLHDPVLFKDLVEHLERTTAVNHVVLRDDLEPIDHRLLGKNVVVMRHAQADTYTVIGKRVETACGHEEHLLSRLSIDDKKIVGGLNPLKPPTFGKIYLLLFLLRRRTTRAVGRALPQSFAAVLAGPVHTLATVQLCAGMGYGFVAGRVWDQRGRRLRGVFLRAGLPAVLPILRGVLRVHAGSRPAKKAGECSCDSEAVCGGGFHVQYLSWLGRASSAPDVLGVWDSGTIPVGMLD